MKRLLFILLLAIPYVSHAGHAAGLDLYYTHISGNTYRVSLTIYGNCNDQPNNNYSAFFNGTPQIAIIDSAAKYTWKTISLDRIIDSTRDVSPYCPRYLDSTNCKSPNYLYQGYTRFIYSDTVTLPSTSSKWIFRFTSAMQSGCSGRLGRPALNNLVGGNGTNVMLEAMLNNASGYNNSSPKFNSSLFTAYCVNVPSSYYQLAKDPNDDSLAFELVAPLREINTCGGSQALPYATGFSPLSTIANGFSFNSTNGTMYFTSDIIQVSAVDTRIYEYHNGQLVGYTMREKIFKVLGTCFNTPPSGDIDVTATSLQGGIWYDKKIVACQGSIIKFDIPVKDQNGDTIKASITGIPSGSNITISNNNSKTPAIKFTWNTTGVPAGTYTFTGAYQDNGCPLKSEGLVTYTIVIDTNGSIHPNLVSPTNCIHKAAVEYDVHSTNYPYTLTVTQGGTIINSITTAAAGVVTDSLAPGTYTLDLTATGSPCLLQAQFEVPDSGTYPFTPIAVSPYEYCRNAEATRLTAQADPGSLTGATFRWYDENMSFISDTPPIPGTSVSGPHSYYVSQQYKTCESALDTVLVNIADKDCNYDVNIHNVITPNGDGKNDKWIVDNIVYYPNMLVQVFDKLGDKVYEKNNYANDWDGGKLPSGVYYYLVRLNGVNKTTGTENFTGYLMIKR